MKEKNDELRHVLYEFGFKPEVSGFDYWLYAFNYLKKNKSKHSKMENLYNEIAEVFKVKPKNVERCMRHCSEPVKQYLQERYKITAKMTNSKILYIIGREFLI